MPDNVYDQHSPTPGPLGPASADDLNLDGLFNAGRLVLRGNFLWVDATGDLRISPTAPGSDLAGTVVGTQT
jgi:hypothetical protein